MSASDGLPPVSEHPAPFGPELVAVMRDHEREADELYADLARPVDAADILPSSLHAGRHSRQWPRVDRTAR